MDQWIAYFICKDCNIKFAEDNDTKAVACCPQCGNSGKKLVEDEIRMRVPGE